MAGIPVRERKPGPRATTMRTRSCPSERATSPVASSRPRLDIPSLVSDAAFCAFYDDFLSAMTELYHAKPILIQDYVSHSPWKVLVAVTLLNKTAGKKSIPVFFQITDKWPTPHDLAQAPLYELYELLKDLGFGQKRSQRLLDISRSFLLDPPDPTRPRPSRGYTTVLSLSAPHANPAHVRKVRYPPTPVSHLPGSGPYALDSYRIFCSPDAEWKSVRPTDKELTKYLQWRWALEAYRKWDPIYGPQDSIDLDYVRALTESLRRDPVEH
ncbi:DNA glycosylase [Cerioporus squamosus]|nr:DNA glycosylase [Cerioporus squamosus]